MNNTYYIFRHGETFASRDNVDYGEFEYTTEILPEGIPAINKLADYLKSIETSANYTSELLRCRQTSGIVSKATAKKFKKFPLLNEFLEASFDEFRARAQKLTAKLEGSKQVYLLCTHGAVISALKHLLTTGKYELENLRDYPKTGTLMIIANGKQELLDFNKQNS